MGNHGKFHWNELMTRDVDAAKKFYADTIGWSFDEFPMPEGMYYVAMLDGSPVGGMMDMTGITPPEVPPHWFSYLEVDDVEARLLKLKEAGGEVLREPFDVPDVGRIAIVTDATGAALGLITPVVMTPE